MANKLPVLTENVLRTRGMEVAKYTSDLRPGFEEMEIGHIFGFTNVKQSSLYSVKSSKERDSWGEKQWDVIGADEVKRIYFVKRLS